MFVRADVDRIKSRVRGKVERGERVKAVCFGASVTFQGSSNGYVTHLRPALADAVPGMDIELDSLAFGSRGLDDAGYFNVDRVVRRGPDVCLLEWHTTEWPRFDEGRYCYILNALLRSDILPVHLILPRRDRVYGNAENIEQTRTMTRVFGLPCIDIREPFARCGSFDQHLRDLVHTRPDGAKLYARLIAGQFSSALATVTATSDEAYRAPAMARPPTFLEFFDRPLTIREGSELRIDLEGQPGDPLEIAAEMLVGPFSPVASVVLVRDGRRIDLPDQTIWDKWCHFTRIALQTLVQSFRPTDRGQFSVHVGLTNKTPPYEQSGQPGFAYHGQRMIVVRRLIGVSCQLVDARVGTSLE